MIRLAEKLFAKEKYMRMSVTDMCEHWTWQIENHNRHIESISDEWHFIAWILSAPTLWCARLAGVGCFVCGSCLNFITFRKGAFAAVVATAKRCIHGAWCICRVEFYKINSDRWFVMRARFSSAPTFQLQMNTWRGTRNCFLSPSIWMHESCFADFYRG